ncbi:MAG: hypothetical protein AAF532_12570 [Planctomycetota bacterium]
MAACLILAGTYARASFITPGFGGVTDYDAWDNLTITNPDIAGAGYPTFFTAGNSWPAPIPSRLTQSTPTTADDDVTGDAEFDKV